MKKNYIKYLIITCSVLLLTGCLGEDNFSDKYTYTTIYPIEYATRELYSGVNNIESIYPNESDTDTYTLTEKQKNKFSKGEIFIYSGLAGEAGNARDLLNINNKLKIIDATKGMNVTNSVEETWLDPSNYLMMCTNIKSSLIEYTENVYTKDKIEENYQTLKENVSVIDVELYNISKNGNFTTLLIADDIFKYLNKYNIGTISLDSDNPSLDRAFSEAKKMINEKSITHIYILKGTNLSDPVEKLISDYKLTKIEITPMYTLTTENRKNGDDYITIMNEILSEYKKELYKK